MMQTEKVDKMDQLKNKILELFEEFKYFSMKQLKIKLDQYGIEFEGTEVTRAVRQMVASGLIATSEEYICNRTGHKVYQFVTRPVKKMSFRISYSKPELEEELV